MSGVAFTAKRKAVDAARSALEMGAVTRAGIYPAAASRFDFWPVATTIGQSAVIGLAFDSDERPSAQSIDVVGSILALALHRQHPPVTHDTSTGP